MILLKFEAVLLKRCLLQPSIALSYPSCKALPSNHHQQQRHFSFQNFWDSVSNSPPVHFMQDSLTQLHDVSGLPWWSSIIVSTIIIRGAITFPLAVHQAKNLTKFEKVTEEMPALVKELKVETAHAMKKFKWNEKQARIMYNHSLKKQYNRLIVRDNCHPAKSTLLVLIQVPLWITLSWSIRNLIYMRPDPSSLNAQLIFTQLTVGGFGWIPNLTEIDHSFILPVTFGVLNLSIIEFQRMSKKAKVDSKLQKYATNFFRVFAVAMVPVAASVPSGLCLYWVTSSAFGFVQNMVLISPKVKRFFKIPQTSSEIERPYVYVLDKIKAKFK